MFQTVTALKQKASQIAKADFHGGHNSLRIVVER
jgi:hypothetical protein